MSMTAMTRRDKTKATPKAAEQGAGEVPVLFRIVTLLDELSRIESAGGPPTGGPQPDSGDRGDDDSHVYLWLELPDRTGPDVDINLHGKTLMVRIEKKRPR